MVRTARWTYYQLSRKILRNSGFQLGQLKEAMSTSETTEGWQNGWQLEEAGWLGQMVEISKWRCLLDTWKQGLRLRVTALVTGDINTTIWLIIKPGTHGA